MIYDTALLTVNVICLWQGRILSFYCCWLRLADSRYVTIWRLSVLWQWKTPSTENQWSVCRKWLMSPVNSSGRGVVMQGKFGVASMASAAGKTHCVQPAAILWFVWRPIQTCYWRVCKWKHFEKTGRHLAKFQARTWRLVFLLTVQQIIRKLKCPWVHWPFTNTAKLLLQVKSEAVTSAHQHLSHIRQVNEQTNKISWRR